MTDRAETPESLNYNSDDTDTISLADTVISNYEGLEDAVWDVETIITKAEFEEVDKQGEVHDVPKYLIKWKGYSMYRCSWEPEENLAEGTPETWRQWQETQIRRARGMAPEFDLDAWEEKVEANKQRRNRRHQRRNRKRKALGLEEVVYMVDEDDLDGMSETSNDYQTAPEPSSDEDVTRSPGKKQVLDNSDDSDEPLAHARKKRRTASAIERDNEHRNELLRRKKGVAIPTIKEVTKSNAKKTTKPSTVKSSTAASAPAARPAISTSKPTAVPTTVTRVAPKSGSHFFSSMTKAKPVVVQTVTTTTGKTAIPPVNASVVEAHEVRPAPPARMVGLSGPSRMVQRSVSTAVTKAGIAPNIFANVHEPVQRRKREPTVGQFRNLQHQNRARKAAQRDAAPSLFQVQLVDPSSRNPVPGNSQQQQAEPRSPVSRRQSGVSEGLSVQSEDSSANDIEEAFRQRTISNTLARPLPSRTLSGLSQPPQPQLPTSISSSSPPKTCYFYAERNFCRYGANCPWPHNNDDSQSMSLRDVKNAVTCWFWKHSKCNTLAEDCQFSHADRPLIASRDNMEAPRPIESDTRGTGGTAGMSCWYWTFYSCKMPRDQCKFAHEPRPFIAARAFGTDPIPWDKAPASRKQALTLETQALVDSRFIRSQAMITSNDSDGGSGFQHPQTSSIINDSVRSPPSPASPMQIFQSPLTSPIEQRAEPRPQIRHEVTLPLTASVPAPRRFAESNNGNEHDLSTPAIDVKFQIQATTSGQLQDVVFDAVLTGLNPEETNKLRVLLTKRVPIFSLRHLCTAKLAAAYLNGQTPNSPVCGEVHTNAQSTDASTQFVENLKNNSAGAVSFHDSFNIIFFPVKQENWKFTKANLNPHPATVLQFTITAPFAPPSTVAHIDNAEIMSKRNTTSIITSVLELNPDRLFRWADKGKLERHVYLMYHAKYADDMKTVEAVLHSFGATVYHSTDSGSWGAFGDKSNNTSGVVIFHPNFYAFDRIPMLAKMFTRSYNFFQLRHQNAQSTALSLRRLFPHGRAYFISQSVFDGNAQEVLAILRKLEDRIRHSGLQNSTVILGRPDLLSWLHGLAVNDLEEFAYSMLVEPDYTRAEIYAILERLFALDAKNPQGPYEEVCRADRLTRMPNAPTPIRPSEKSFVYFPLSSDLPGYLELAERDPAAAENFMADWFSQWALQHVGEFRRFYLVASGLSAKEWKNRYKHMEVIAPGMLLNDSHEQSKSQQQRDKQRKDSGK